MPDRPEAPARPPARSRTDRQALADVLLAAGPDAPTLCEGWATRDLALHLVVRDGRPDLPLGRLAGKVLAPLGRAAAGGMAALEALPHAEVVRRLRSGPPSWSPARLAPVEQLVNGVEFYVHAEDVRRASPGWAPSPADAATLGAAGPLAQAQRAGGEQLWRAVRTGGRLLYRRSPVGVVLQVPSGPRAAVRRGDGPVVLTGQPEELLLHAFGRRSVAQVDVGGPPEAVAAFERTFPAP